jgi:hypothetical protein
MGKTTTPEFDTAHLALQGTPRLFVRFFTLVGSGPSATEAAFSRDFSSGAIQAETKPKLTYLVEITGNTQVVQPERGRSEHGQFRLRLQDAGDEVTRYCANPKRKLGVAMTASVPANGGNVEAKAGEDIAGYPAAGTLLIDDERVRYASRDPATRLFQNVTRAVDGTTAAVHAVDALLHNGEEIRPGIRAQVFVGYALVDEVKYLPLPKMQVYERDFSPDGLDWIVVIADIQRATARRIFGSATQDQPIIIFGNKVHLALRVLLTTAEGGNSKYDRGDGEGLGVPQALVDIAGLETLAAGFGVQKYRFVESGPQEGKTWLEDQIWKTLNCYPFVLPDGKYSAIRYAPAPAPGSQPLLDDTNTVGLPRYKPGDRLIINVVEIWYDWDHANSTFQTRQVWVEPASITKYGRQPPLVIEDRGLASDLGAQEIADDRTNRVFARYADPPDVLEVAGHWDHLVRDVGDIVRATFPRIPNRRTGLRGLANEVMEVTDLSPIFPFTEGAVAHVRMTLLHTGAITAPAPVTGIISAPVAIPTPTRYLVEAIPVRNDQLKAKYTGLTSLWGNGYQTNNGVPTGAGTVGVWRREAFSGKIDPSSGPDITF